MILKLRKKLIFFAVVLMLISTSLLIHLGLSMTDMIYNPSKMFVSHSSSNIIGDILPFGKKHLTKESFYKDLFLALEKFKPPKGPEDKNSLKDKTCDLHDVSFGSTDPTDGEYLSYAARRKCFRPSEVSTAELKKSHLGFIKHINRHLTVDTKSALFNELFPKEAGIVTVGGGKYSILALTMLRALREHGTKLPVEVLIPEGDIGDIHFCRAIRKWNAECILLPKALPNTVSKLHDFKSYETKLAALLLSSFKDVILIDADNIPIKPLDDVFESEPYKETGLILWPDIWRRQTAPVFYEIADIDIDFRNRIRNSYDDLSPPSRYKNPDVPNDAKYNMAHVPLHDLAGAIPDLSSESGQLLVNKGKHLSTLLLALYYNYYGEQWFYQMSSLGTSGQGDKETFIFAAHALKKPYYQVKNPLLFDGYFGDDGSFKGVGLLQHDFTQDYANWKKAKEYMTENIAHLGTYNSDYNVNQDFKDEMLHHKDFDGVDIMFIHASFHKLIPWDLYREKIYLDKSGKQFRSFKNLKNINYFDVELFAFEGLQKYICSDDAIKFEYHTLQVTSTESFNAMCAYIDDRVKMLRETHEEAISSNDK
ncbi:alpha-1,2-mannosyltransferase MNN5 Ecym_8128 [Eremothecium cymbalariae DBVPG|uniref:Uncharacterized protein n=1 Tax=Eremothecium cymbalariae (strain CBS 270.75 / DBVPG 7215 / KCTC 17166 / NRRL Y-17582) TaxID=931890 RepID=G8JX45_ERECY|nr:Hypothetical protein Ecym_8128 [Eremothecium cymbalariae DBVPG\